MATLDELQLDRFLGNNSSGNSSADPVSISLNAFTSSVGEPNSVPSNSAAYDVNQGTVIIRADHIDTKSINLENGFVNTQLTSIALPANGIRVDYNGIYGRNAGQTTFSINTDGNAFFSGDIEARSLNLARYAIQTWFAGVDTFKILNTGGRGTIVKNDLMFTAHTGTQLNDETGVAFNNDGVWCAINTEKPIFECWAYVWDPTVSSNDYILGMHGYQYGIYFRYDGVNNKFYCCYRNEGVETAHEVSVPTGSVVYRFKFSYDSTTIKYYIDDVEIYSTDFVFTGDAPTNIGLELWAGGFIRYKNINPGYIRLIYMSYSQENFSYEE